MDNDTLFGYTASGLITIGGLIGYLRRGSLPSLVAGSGAGMILAWSTEKQSRNPKDVAALVGVSAALVVVMGKRFARSGAFMPAGLVCIIALALLARFAPRML